MILVEIADIVFLLIVMVAEREADGAGGEVVHGVPDSRGNQHPFVGAVHSYHYLILAVAEMQVEGAGDCDEHCGVFAVGVTPAGLATGHIVDVEDSLYRKWHVATFLNEGKIAPWVTYFGEFENFYFVEKTSHPLLPVFVSFELGFEGLDGEIKRFLEGVGCL